MSDEGVAAKRIDDLPQLWDGFAKLVREGLGITAFGVQIMDLPPDYRTKSHDESETGQEELYIALRGSGAVVVTGDPEVEHRLDPDHVVRVRAGVDRILASGPEGMRVLCVGGTPGKPYAVPEWTTGDG